MPWANPWIGRLINCAKQHPGPVRRGPDVVVADKSSTLLHREANALAPCFEADSRFAALQCAPYCLCAFLARHLAQHLHMRSGPIIRLFTASHILSSNGLGKRPIVTLWIPNAYKKTNITVHQL